MLFVEAGWTQVMHGHSHFGTVSLEFTKDFDLVKLNRALGQLLTENGADIFRGTLSTGNRVWSFMVEWCSQGHCSHSE